MSVDEQWFPSLITWFSPKLEQPELLWQTCKLR